MSVRAAALGNAVHSSVIDDPTIARNASGIQKFLKVVLCVSLRGTTSRRSVTDIKSDK